MAQDDDWFARRVSHVLFPDVQPDLPVIHPMLYPVYRLGGGNTQYAEDETNNEGDGNTVLFHGHLHTEGFPI
jgi:hypothetical protein